MWTWCRVRTGVTGAHWQWYGLVDLYACPRRAEKERLVDGVGEMIARVHARTLTGLLAVCLHACSSAEMREPAATKADGPAADVALTRTVLVDGLRDPWDLGFLPDGTLLITEREGQIVVRRPSGERLVL